MQYTDNVKCTKVNILENISLQGVETQILILLTPKSANFCIFTQKSVYLDNFPLLKVKNMGKFFHNSFADQGKNVFWGAEY